MKRIILAALVGVLVSGPAWGQERALLKEEPPPDLMLICTDKLDVRYFLLQPANDKVRQVDGNTTIEGKLEVGETTYIMHFPKQKVTVNRYSGRMVRESLTDPYIPDWSNKPTTTAVYAFGTCKEGTPQRRF